MVKVTLSLEMLLMGTQAYPGSRGARCLSHSGIPRSLQARLPSSLAVPTWAWADAWFLPRVGDRDPATSEQGPGLDLGHSLTGVPIPPRAAEPACAVHSSQTAPRSRGLLGTRNPRCPGVSYRRNLASPAVPCPGNTFSPPRSAFMGSRHYWLEYVLELLRDFGPPGVPTSDQAVQGQYASFRRPWAGGPQVSDALAGSNHLDTHHFGGAHSQRKMILRLQTWRQLFPS